MKRSSIAISAALFLVPCAQLHAAPAYHVAKEVPLGTPDKWDFIHYDPAGDRIYIAHATEVTVVDGKSGSVVGRVADIKGAHDVAIADGFGYADNGKTGAVTKFDLATFKAVGTIPADDDSDAMLYDAKSGKLFVANGDAHSLSIIDVKTAKRIANMPLPGSPEMMAAGSDGKIYINIASANEIVRVDLTKAAIDATWKVPVCESPHGLAMDKTSNRLFASCHNKVMVVVDASTGKTLTSLPIGAGTDGAAFDPQRNLAFSSNRDGTLSVIHEEGPNSFVSLGNVSTAPGARTMGVDPLTGRVFLVTGDVSETLPARAAGEEARVTFKSGSAKLLILEPEK